MKKILKWGIVVSFFVVISLVVMAFDGTYDRVSKVTNERLAEEELEQDDKVTEEAMELVSDDEEEEENAEEEKEEEEYTEDGKDFPTLSEETMDRNLIFSCAGGDTVNLWSQPSSATEGARVRDKVDCGERGWAFNDYYDDENNITWYAVQEFDGSRAYGWLTEDLISWRD